MKKKTTKENDLHEVIWFNPYGWLSERLGIGVKYSLSTPSFRFKTLVFTADASVFDDTFAEFARRTRTLNDGDVSKQLSVTSFEMVPSSFSNSTWMPESPLLHLSRRWCFVFRRSLLVRQINGPKRYLAISVPSLHVAAGTLATGTLFTVVHELLVTWFVCGIVPLLADDRPFRLENVFRNFCKTLLVVLFVVWFGSTVGTFSSCRGFFGHFTVSNWFSHIDGLDTARICCDCKQTYKHTTYRLYICIYILEMKK